IGSWRTCDLAGDPPAPLLFRATSHHSHFRCLVGLVLRSGFSSFIVLRCFLCRPWHCDCPVTVFPKPHFPGRSSRHQRALRPKTPVHLHASERQGRCQCRTDCNCYFAVGRCRIDPASSEQ
ncbi:hypothetical protein TcCL_Unassigned04948, partial [Trypanosoma cruzi]